MIKEKLSESYGNVNPTFSYQLSVISYQQEKVYQINDSLAIKRVCNHLHNNQRPEKKMWFPPFARFVAPQSGRLSEVRRMTRGGIFKSLE